jgi:Ca2+-binding RTX toxin-like protein
MSGLDLVLSIDGNDVLHLRDDIAGVGTNFFDYDDLVFQFIFNGGPTKTIFDIISEKIVPQGTSGNDLMYLPHFFNQTAVTLQGGQGNDTYRATGTVADHYQVAANEGTDIIYDKNSSAGDTLNFSGIASSAVSFFNLGTTLVADISGADNRVFIDNQGSNGRIESFIFSDQTLSYTSVASLANANNDQSLTGTSGSDTMNGGAGADTLAGAGGSDTYQYNSGDGYDYINDTGGTNDRLVLGTGLTSDKLRISRLENDRSEIILTFQGIEGAIFINDQSPNNLHAIEQVVFGNGETMTGAQLDAFYFSHASTSGDDFIQSFHSTNGTMSGGDGDDSLFGHNGSDSIDGGNGNDTIDGAAASIHSMVEPGTIISLKRSGSHSLTVEPATMSFTAGALKIRHRAAMAMIISMGKVTMTAWRAGLEMTRF